ncbi:transporter substrate-binding domain-containing protein [Acuticoccus sp. MNP-M23]|uniref:substrate-binding periplasmic protein n=1 Tax=Acuticoccus sp. MNP-M23 TaxID=3072793 RepID=UPI00281604BA|nr:transporter substrate-binding domain-containing protein [Acuticoccus sp. MNP-M23]WMS42691.1 transporter substrate-binding domain-containing protein [Acuticoccus sp. MNP-M23]
MTPFRVCLAATLLTLLPAGMAAAQSPETPGAASGSMPLRPAASAPATAPTAEQGAAQAPAPEAAGQAEAPQVSSGPMQLRPNVEADAAVPPASEDAAAAKRLPAAPSEPPATTAAPAVPPATADAAAPEVAPVNAAPAGEAAPPRERRSLLVGISDNAPPFSTTSRFGVRGGFDVEVTLAICLRLEADCRLVPLVPSEMSAALKDRRVDLIIASSGGMDRVADVAAFSVPYVSLVALYVVPRETTKDLETEESTRYAAVTDTIYAQYLTEIHKRPGAVRLYDQASEMWIDLALGRIDAALATAVTARKDFLSTPMGEQFRLSTVPVKDPSVGAREAAFAVRRNDTTLKNDLDVALKDYLASTEYKETLLRHLGGGLANPPQPAPAATGG